MAERGAERLDAGCGHDERDGDGARFNEAREGDPELAQLRQAEDQIVAVRRNILHAQQAAEARHWRRRPPAPRRGSAAACPQIVTRPLPLAI